MKHLLIILSFLLLSSPVIGEETPPVSGNEYLRCLRSNQDKWAKEFKTGEKSSEEDVICEEPEIGEETLPVSGGKGVTLYEWITSGIYDPYSGIIPSTKVWKYFGDRKTQPVYKGEVENGVPNGLGVLISTNGWKYFGSWKNGEIWKGTEYDNYGNIIYRWVEGKRKYHNLYRSY